MYTLYNVREIYILCKMELSIYSSDLSPVQQNEMMHHYLEAVKLTNRVCQKTHTYLDTKLQQPENLAHFHSIAKTCIGTDIQVLQSGIVLQC